MSGARCGVPVRILCAAVLANLLLGTLFAWSLFVEPVQSALNVSRAAVSTVFSLSLVAFAVAVLGAGSWIDRGRVPHVMATATIGSVGGLLLTAGAPNLLILIFGYAGLFGAASGLGYAAVVAVATKLPSRLRGLATGLVVGAFALGPVLLSPAAEWSNRIAGWRMTMVALAAVIGLGLSFVSAALRQAQLPSSSPDPTPGERHRHRRQDPPVLLLAVIFLLASLPGLAAFGHAAAMMTTAGTPRLATGAVSLLGAGNLIGRLLAGGVSDRLGRFPVLAASLGATGVASAYLGWQPPVLPLLLVIGLGYGALSALMPVITADLSGAVQSASAYGRVFLGWGVAGLLAPYVAGLAFDATGGYELMFRGGLASTGVAACLTAALARNNARGVNSTQ